MERIVRGGRHLEKTADGRSGLGLGALFDPGSAENAEEVGSGVKELNRAEKRDLQPLILAGGWFVCSHVWKKVTKVKGYRKGEMIVAASYPD